MKIIWTKSSDIKPGAFHLSAENDNEKKVLKHFLEFQGEMDYDLAILGFTPTRIGIEELMIGYHRK